MEQTQQKVSVRALVDKEKNKVVFVEAGGDFVDILLSFLTLPMATIIRLIKACPDGPPDQVKVGSLNTLYQSVVNVEPKYLSSDQCKDLLITPKNLREDMCKRLKINVENTEPLRYFLCRNCCSGLSTKENTRCSCGKLMNWKIGVNEDSNNATGEYEGIFVSESASFIITDDLCIKENSVGESLSIINNLGIKDMKKVDSLSISFGFKEITYLLKLSLISKTPMTDLVVGNIGLSDMKNSGLGIALSNSGLSTCKAMTIRLMVQKSVKKVLFALVEEDFVDFLFSILGIPLGSVLLLSGYNSNPGTLDKLYGSIDVLKALQHPPIPRGGFVLKPAKFMVTDDLVVTPLTSTSSISALDLLKVPISDVQQTPVPIGPKEALRILKACVYSTSVLTDFYFNKS
ncbi:hypothetical protein POM88_024228 [Heracleum sosnowskyi]|uniref:DUF674 family protein n=1 Tax=Heracleum sosnowskyi TaxID=360622 RepID=A0AAD8I1L5_9APIA|nr:hypothetical protein POM88_024228 [Heracleum sosnowskyi]